MRLGHGEQDAQFYEHARMADLSVLPRNNFDMDDGPPALPPASKLRGGHSRSRLIVGGFIARCMTAQLWRPKFSIMVLRVCTSVLKFEHYDGLPLNNSILCNLALVSATGVQASYALHDCASSGPPPM